MPAPKTWTTDSLNNRSFMFWELFINPLPLAYSGKIQKCQISFFLFFFLKTVSFLMRENKNKEKKSKRFCFQQISRLFVFCFFKYPVPWPTQNTQPFLIISPLDMLEIKFPYTKLSLVFSKNVALIITVFIMLQPMSSPFCYSIDVKAICTLQKRIKKLSLHYNYMFSY